MKIHKLILIIQATLLFTVAIPFSIYSESRIRFTPDIDSVVVYPDRAVISRKKTVTLPAGRSFVVFEEGSPELDPGSLRGFSETDGCIVQDVTSRNIRSTKAIDPGLQKLEAKLENLKKKKADEAGIISSRNQDLSWLESYSSYLVTAFSQGSVTDKPDRWNDALKLVEKERLKARLEKEEAQTRMMDIDTDIAITEKEIAKIRTDMSRSSRTIEIITDCLKDASAMIGFTYAMHGVSFNVSYGLYKNESSFELEYYASIRQKTGEDWNQVKVSISTARPAEGAMRPDLPALSLFARKVEVQRQYRRQERESRIVADVEESEVVKNEENTGGEVEISESVDTANAVLFVINTPSTIPSDNQSHRVTITRMPLKFEKEEYRFYPEHSKSAYLVATLKNESNYPLLAGQGDLYRASGYSGKTSISYTPPGSSFVSGMGVEAALRMERSVLTRRESAGILSSRIIIKKSIRSILKNTEKDVRMVTHYEKIPVSHTEDVSVRILKETTTGYTEEKPNSGILKWTLTLKPGESRLVELHYETEIPSGFPENLLP